jgi:hypothetical protein
LTDRKNGVTMIYDDKFTELRCSAIRKHTVKGVEYETCGHLWGGADVNKDTDIVLRCPICGAWWNIQITNNVVDMTQMKTSKDNKILFKRQWRKVHGVH